MKENAKIIEVSRVNMISTIEKIAGDLGSFLSNNYFSNSLMEEKSTLIENSLNFVHYYQKNQFDFKPS